MVSDLTRTPRRTQANCPPQAPARGHDWGAPPVMSTSWMLRWAVPCISMGAESHGIAEQILQAVPSSSPANYVKQLERVLCIWVPAPDVEQPPTDSKSFRLAAPLASGPALCPQDPKL